jgi:ferrous iron transport protein A
MKLRDLKAGDKAVVVGYEEGDSSYRSKLLSMGLTRGSVIKIVK